MKVWFVVFAILLRSSVYAAQVVEIRGNHLVVDGAPQTQLYGAELQYFRLRGGEGRNIPRAKVIELWNRALDHMVEAKMNAISFYIPWDFHEYAEGKFDFTGTADEDGDGNPDYPSRDLFTFLRLIEEHGIKNIMVRPGPYINAEWGFLGFGAIPLWFHEKYPDSHMRSPEGLRTKLYDYHNPDLLRHTRLWFEELHRQVLSRFIGPGKPILFLQLDNETNFMWQSRYNHDYGAPALARYRGFLKGRYGSLDELNQAQAANWKNWEEVTAPTAAATATPGAAQDWYRFQDDSIFKYLQIVRSMWERIGVKEPRVLFTLAESYNAMTDGLLPNFKLRNSPGHTGMMTMNMYPKTYESANHSLLNLPFKSDHDVKAMNAAKNYYLGHDEDWLMGPEIQGGWWRGTDVSVEARRQTYLSSLGHGLKALFVYYFSEGDNWQSGWARAKIAPMFETLKTELGLGAARVENLPDRFWENLQKKVDRELLVGFYARGVMTDDPGVSAKLYFDAPLDAEARPSRHFELLKTIGEKIVAPYGELLADAVELTDPVVLLKDSGDHVPSSVPALDSMKLGAEWSGGLLGYFLNAGVNPSIQHWDLLAGSRAASAFRGQAVVIRQDSGVTPSALTATLAAYLRNGGTVINWLGDSLARDLGLGVVSQAGVAQAGAQFVEVVDFMGQGTHARFSIGSGPLSTYDLSQSLASSACEPLLWGGGGVVGYRCRVGAGSFVQIGALVYDGFNSDAYASLDGLSDRVAFLKSLLGRALPETSVTVEGGDRVVAFARVSEARRALWVTIKSGASEPREITLRFSAKLLGKLCGARGVCAATDPLSGERLELPRADLAVRGVRIRLKPGDSLVRVIIGVRDNGRPAGRPVANLRAVRDNGRPGRATALRRCARLRCRPVANLR